MNMPTAFRRPARPRVPRIELDTPIVPRAVAEGVCEEAGLWLGQPLPPKPPVPPQAMLRPQRGAVRTPRPSIDRRVRPPARVRPRPDPGYAFAAAAHFHFP